MEPQIHALVDISESEAARNSIADVILEQGHWATEVFQRYDRDKVQRIVEAVANCIEDNAARYAEWTVEESGFGVVADKTQKNRLTGRPLVDFYKDEDFVNPQVDKGAKIVRIPRPAGVIFALVPSTNPIATINFKILIALMTRNAIVVSPHPAVRECCTDAVKKLAQCAVEAGAPQACIQVIENPTIPLIECFMKSAKTNLILATGGTAMVRAAYSSSNPAIGVGPGNVPVFVDESADFKKAAQRIVDSKSFDNSVLCTNESVLITTQAAGKRLLRELEFAHAHICDEYETSRLRDYLFHERGFNVEALGRDACWIANECGIRVPTKTRILITPIRQIGIEEKLSREKLCPVLAYYEVSGRRQAIMAARAILRLTGAGHSAAFHGRDEATALEYAHQVEAYRVVVNAPCSQGASGLSTNLAPTFTVGTGFFGRSSIGENIGPKHLVHWTQMAYNSDSGESFGDYQGLHLRHDGPLPTAPADGVPGSTRARGHPSVGKPRSSMNGNRGTGGLDPAIHDELRRLIVEELRSALKGDE